VIPKDLKNLPPAAVDQIKLIHHQQTDLVAARAEGKNKYDIRQETIIGDCTCCKRKSVKIVKKREMICYMCYQLCVGYIKNRYSYYHSRFIPEAILEVRKPVKCKFCPTLLWKIDPKTGEHTKNRKRICEVCWVIWYAGWVAGNREKHRSKYLHRPGLVKEPKLYVDREEGAKGWLDLPSKRSA
jgi:hypothetical protein